MCFKTLDGQRCLSSSGHTGQLQICFSKSRSLVIIAAPVRLVGVAPLHVT